MTLKQKVLALMEQMPHTSDGLIKKETLRVILKKHNMGLVDEMHVEQQITIAEEWLKKNGKVSELETLKAENARLREAMQKAYDFLNRKHVMDASAKITLEKALEQ